MMIYSSASTIIYYINFRSISLLSLIQITSGNVLTLPYYDLFGQMSIKTLPWNFSWVNAYIKIVYVHVVHHVQLIQAILKMEIVFFKDITFGVFLVVFKSQHTLVVLYKILFILFPIYNRVFCFIQQVFSHILFQMENFNRIVRNFVGILKVNVHLLLSTK